MLPLHPDARKCWCREFSHTSRRIGGSGISNSGVFAGVVSGGAFLGSSLCRRRGSGGRWWGSLFGYSRWHCAKILLSILWRFVFPRKSVWWHCGMPSCQSQTDEADTSSKSLNSSWWTADGHTSHRTVKTSWLLGQGIPLFMGVFLSFDFFYSITVRYNITLFSSTRHMSAVNKVHISHNVVVMWPSGHLELHFHTLSD